MFKKSVLFACFTSLVMLLSPPPVSSKFYCDPSSCGNIHNIRHPFRLKGDPSHCGLKEYELSCDNNNRTILQWHSGIFYVVEIDYTSSLIRVVDPGIQKDNCSAWPLYSLKTDGNFVSSSSDPYDLSSPYNTGYTFVKYIYASEYIALVVVARAACGIPFFFAFLVCKWRRRHLSMYENIEDFIQSHNNLTPVRYSYSDIKKMTKGFKDKLGEGGYGCVYKGKLRSGHLVAVKILGNSKANEQDFINEVATIGRIHHVNVVQLIGFCVERSKRALVYDFMPNGSLEKYIFPREEGNFFLSCEKLYEISLGIAYGIEYLHRGCDMQVLHFDIKPHNILLDNKFIPKVSDFGLAKLYPTNDSIVNLTAARGTMGCMAPELFYKNIGGVSYKADVYSFGMLLMEMARKRKNLNPFVEHLSQIYFPSWVYDQFNDGNDIEMGDATKEERKIVMKMIIVALWCI